MTDELKQWEYDKGYAKGYSDGRASLIEELEKIKWEIIHTEGCCNYTHCRQCIMIIDKHISESKGD